MALSVDIETTVGNFSLAVSFTAQPGEITGLLGASGCGKTLTLQTIAGIRRPDRGRIVLDGRVLFDSAQGIDLPPQQRRVGYLFQNYALFPHRTVRGNLRVATADEGRIDQLLHVLQLTAHTNKYPRQLSGGQQQRVALARMLAADPALILLDEPFSALDPHLKWQITGEVQEFLKAFHGPAILVSHDRQEVARLCRTVCILEQGQSQPTVDVQDFLTRPRTVAAAQLAGCSNVFTRQQALALGLPDLHTDHVAVWPHGIQIVPQGLRCTVAQTTPGHFSTLLMVHHGDLPLYLEVPSAALRPGDAVCVAIPPDALLPLYG